MSDDPTRESKQAPDAQDAAIEGSDSQTAFDERRRKKRNLFRKLFEIFGDQSKL